MAKLNHRIRFAGLELTLILVLCPSVLRAQDYRSIREQKIERAYQQLLHAKIFNLGGYGFAMTISPEERAFHTLLESSNSTALLKKLLQANGKVLLTVQAFLPFHWSKILPKEIM